MKSVTESVVWRLAAVARDPARAKWSVRATLTSSAHRIVAPCDAPASSTIGRYRVDRLLGEGGMGVVYAARDERLQRHVAIKLLREAEALGGRVCREARAAAAVSHPNVCHVYEVAEEGETIYIVMELLAGQPLSERIARGPLPVREAVPIALGILAALDALRPPSLSGGAAMSALGTIVRTCLEKRPEDRYPDPAAIARDIRAVVAMTDSGEAPIPRPTTRLMVLPFRLLRADPEIDSIETIIDIGFTCPQMRALPWLSPLAGNERFERLMARAEEGRRHAAAASTEAGGDRLLGEVEN